MYGPRHAEDVWNLFDCFLKYIYLQENEGRHRIAAYVHQIIRSEDAVLELQCLVVAVAVEGLLKTEFETSDSADHIRESISQLTMAIDGTSVADEVKKRAIGAISGLRTTRPYDKLLELSERGLIPLEEVRAWKALRNSATHADKFGSSNFQEYLNKYYQVLTLFNRLVFLKIGYVGHFTNYGKYEGQSWLVQKFGNRIQTEENKK